ncbi:Protein of unknown function, partial [Gryllus bimaculatus]
AREPPAQLLRAAWVEPPVVLRVPHALHRAAAQHDAHPHRHLDGRVPAVAFLHWRPCNFSCTVNSPLLGLRITSFLPLTNNFSE